MPQGQTFSKSQRLQEAYRHNGIEEGRLRRFMNVIEKQHKYDSVTYNHDIVMTRRTLQFINECTGWSAEAKEVREQEEAKEARKIWRENRIKSAPPPQMKWQEAFQKSQGVGQMLNRKGSQGSQPSKPYLDCYFKETPNDVIHGNQDVNKGISQSKFKGTLQWKDLKRNSKNDITSKCDDDDVTDNDSTCTGQSDTTTFSQRKVLGQKNRPNTVHVVSRRSSNTSSSEGSLAPTPASLSRRRSSEIERSMDLGFQSYGIKPPKKSANNVLIHDKNYLNSKHREVLKDIDVERKKSLQKKLEQFRSLYPISV